MDIDLAHDKSQSVLRQRNGLALLSLVLGLVAVGSVVSAGHKDREAVADQGAALVGMAAESFNDGVRAYYFAFAVIAWFVSPVAFAVGVALVVAVLYLREFRSQVLTVLRG